MSGRGRRAIRWIGLLVCLAVLLTAGLALARVGGGESYGGGGSSGGGGGDGDLFWWLIYLAITYPHVGIPLLGIFGVFWYFKRRHQKVHGLPATSFQKLNQARSGGLARQQRKLKGHRDRLLEDDPNFSEILFLDFAQMIYTRYQQARGSSDVQGLQPYLDEDMLEGLSRIGTQLAGGSFQVEDVVVGSVTLVSVVEQDGFWRATCEVEANYTERSKPRDEKETIQAFFSRSRVFFRRVKGVLSKGPDEMRTLGCPSCGSPIKLDDRNVCAYCNRPAEPGVFHWELFGLEEGMRMYRRDVPLKSGGVELGTDFPTVFDPDLDTAAKAFLMRYPGESLKRLEDRAREVFVKLQLAWTSGNWEQARGFETDRLFQMHLFWTDRYKRRRWKNLLEEIQVQDATLVKLSRDAFHEIATLRIRASMIDYTLDRYDKLVSGSRDEARVFSEYWTFARRSGFEPGKAGDTGSCPSCGAPVQVGMHGRCDYCDASLSSGEFDWTLAKIEQDESYAG